MDDRMPDVFSEADLDGFITALGLEPFGSEAMQIARMARHGYVPASVLERLLNAILSDRDDGGSAADLMELTAAVKLAEQALPNFKR